MTSDIPVPTEADYLDAARANVTALLTSPRDAMTPEDFERTVANYAALPSHRAAVDSAYAAGWRAHAEIVGPCMDSSPRFGGCTPMHCELPAGHAGAHTFLTSSWTRPAPMALRRVGTPLGERVAYLRDARDLPAGWTDLGPYGPELTDA